MITINLNLILIYTFLLPLNVVMYKLNKLIPY